MPLPFLTGGEEFPYHRPKAVDLRPPRNLRALECTSAVPAWPCGRVYLRYMPRGLFRQCGGGQLIYAPCWRRTGALQIIASRGPDTQVVAPVVQQPQGANMNLEELARGKLSCPETAASLFSVAAGKAGSPQEVV